MLLLWHALRQLRGHRWLVNVHQHNYTAASYAHSSSSDAHFGSSAHAGKHVATRQARGIRQARGPNPTMAPVPPTQACAAAEAGRRGMPAEAAASSHRFGGRGVGVAAPPADAAQAESVLAVQQPELACMRVLHGDGALGIASGDRNHLCVPVLLNTQHDRSALPASWAAAWLQHQLACHSGSSCRGELNGQR